MIKQDETNMALTDAELEAAAGGSGKWVQGASGRWSWHTSESSTQLGPNGAISRSSTSGSSPLRMAEIGGQRHYYSFDGTKETLKTVR